MQSGRGQVPEAQQGETRVTNALTGSGVGNVGRSGEEPWPPALMFPKPPVPPHFQVPAEGAGIAYLL